VLACWRTQRRCEGLRCAAGVSGRRRAGGRYQLPLAELGGDFYDELKSLSSGYASFDYAEGPARRADLVRPANPVRPGPGVAGIRFVAE